MTPKFKSHTKGDHPVRIIATDRDDPFYPIVALIRSSDQEYILSYTPTGQAASRDTDYDLIPIPTIEVGKVYNNYQILAHRPDVNPTHPWLAVSTDYIHYLYWVNDEGVSAYGYLDLLAG